MKDEWQLKHTNNINQMLRVNDTLNANEHYSELLIIKHQYHVADDVMFPDPACLAFFTAFEEIHLEKLQENGSIKLVAVDIFEGLMQFFIYCTDAKHSVYDTIEFLKSNDNYLIEFEISQDPSWAQYYELIK